MMTKPMPSPTQKKHARFAVGWFNRIFAYATLVAPVKKLGEGRAPDVRHVAVGREAERRGADERALVDNMKEACVSASMGLEVRFDKMHACNADMEAARREAPADIEWPELDSH
eukprot:jgi/Tetstr1/455057/TSEL_041912.t1